MPFPFPRLYLSQRPWRRLPFSFCSLSPSLHVGDSQRTHAIVFLGLIALYGPSLSIALSAGLLPWFRPLNSLLSSMILPLTRLFTNTTCASYGHCPCSHSRPIALFLPLQALGCLFLDYGHIQNSAIASATTFLALSADDKSTLKLTTIANNLTKHFFYSLASFIQQTTSASKTVCSYCQSSKFLESLTHSTLHIVSITASLSLGIAYC